MRKYLSIFGGTLQFRTDTEVSAHFAGVWDQVGYEGELEAYAAMAPYNELDLEKLKKVSKEMAEVAWAMYSTHNLGTPHGPWFFIENVIDPETGEAGLVLRVDPQNLRPQVLVRLKGGYAVGSELGLLQVVFQDLADAGILDSPVPIFVEMTRGAGVRLRLKKDKNGE
jgi:hypothetical protein